ncbi:MAG: flippase-like domain-containing protein [Clostridiales bacterium]|nr:flippase-like domain-containing protein [Clostridiales bacterium]
MKKFFYGLFAILTIYLIFTIDFTKLFEALSKIPLEITILLILLQVVTHLLIGLQWKDILKSNGVDITLLKMLFINIKGSIIEGVTPGVKIGSEAYKALAIKEHAGNKTSESASYVVLQKLYSMTGFVFFSIISGLYVIASIDNINLVVTIAYILLGLAVLLLTLMAIFRPENVASLIIGKSKVAIKLRDFLELYSKSANNISKRKSKVAYQLVLSFLIWFLFPMKMYILLDCFSQPHIIAALAITFISYSAGNIPILPGGLGSFEATMTALISLLTSLSLVEGLAVTVIFRFITFWLVIALGGLIVSLVKIREFCIKTRWLKYER